MELGGCCTSAFALVIYSVLKDQDSINQVSIRSIQKGNPSPLRWRKWRRLKLRINEKKTQYNDRAVISGCCIEPHESKCEYQTLKN